MAPSRISARTAAVSTGLLALLCGTGSTGTLAGAALDGDVTGRVPAQGTASARTAQPAQASQGRSAYALLGHGTASTRTAGSAATPVSAPGTSAPAARTELPAAQRVRLSGLSGSESYVRALSAPASTSETKSLLEQARRAKPVKATPSPTATPTTQPTGTPTTAPTSSPTPTPTVTADPGAAPAPAPAPTATASATATPTPTATATPTVAPTATPSAAPSATPTPTATSTPAPVPSVTVNPVSPSGVSVPKGDLVGWKQVYAEDFGTAVPLGGFPGTAYGSHWGVYDDGWKDTSRNGTYMPSKVMSVHDGLLDYYIHSENGVHMVSAPWVTTTKGQTYGRYSVRFKADPLPGYKTAWLLWPDSERWPDDGEIDFPEGNLGANDTIHAFSHYASATGGQDAFSTSATYASWHTATVEWTPGRVNFLLDDKVIGTSTKNVPATAMHWVLQTETNLDGYAPSNTVSGHVYVDWVAVWTRA